MKAIAPMCRAGFPDLLREPFNRFDSREVETSEIWHIASFRFSATIRRLSGIAGLESRSPGRFMGGLAKQLAEAIIPGSSFFALFRSAKHS